MDNSNERYTKLRTYEILWKKFMMGFDLEIVRRIVYNPAVNAKQKIVFCDGKEFMRIKVTAEVMNIIKRMLNPNHIVWIREAR